MKYRGDKAASFAEKPNPACWAVLAFGEDQGVVSDAAQSLTRAWSKTLNDLEVITLDEDSVRKDATLLFDNLEAVSLLGGDRVIKLRTNGDKLAKLLTEAIQMGDADPGRFAARLIIQAGALQTRSKLRAVAESAKLTASLQLFADDSGDVSSLVSKSLKAENIAIEDDALALFASNLPGHRGIARTEIEKLCLYGLHLDRPLNVRDIRSLTATDVDHALGAVIDAALNGNTDLTHNELDKLNIAGTSPISVLRALERETNRMLDVHAAIASGARDPGMKARPPVFQSQWGAYRKRLSKWPPRRLTRLLERLYDAEKQAKLAGPTADPVMRNLINDITRAAQNA